MIISYTITSKSHQQTLHKFFPSTSQKSTAVNKLLTTDQPTNNTNNIDTNINNINDPISNTKTNTTTEEMLIDNNITHNNAGELNIKENKTNKDYNEWNLASFNAESKLIYSIEEIEEVMREQNTDIIAIQDCGYSCNQMKQFEEINDKYTRTEFIVLDKNTYNSTHLECLPKLDKAIQTSISIFWRKELGGTEPKIDKFPNKQCIHLLFQDTKIMIINIYILPRHKSNKLRKKQIRHLKVTLKQNDVNKIQTIIMGDLNMIANESLDRQSPTNKISNRDTSEIRTLLNMGLTDTFRELHDTKRKFSRFGVSKNKPIGTRLDYILISKELKQKLIKADILEETILDSDHRIINATLTMQNQTYKLEKPMQTRDILKIRDL